MSINPTQSWTLSAIQGYHFLSLHNMDGDHTEQSTTPFPLLSASFGPVHFDGVFITTINCARCSIPPPILVNMHSPLRLPQEETGSNSLFNEFFKPHTEGCTPRVPDLPKRTSTQRLSIGMPQNFQHCIHVDRLDPMVLLATASLPSLIRQRSTSPQLHTYHQDYSTTLNVSSSVDPQAVSIKKQRSFALVTRKKNHGVASIAALKEQKSNFSTLTIGSPQKFQHISHLGIGQEPVLLPSVPPQDAYDAEGERLRREFDEQIEVGLHLRCLHSHCHPTLHHPRYFRS
ncbi:hypothetical protein K439DRAFT_106070 [Ramaria rubella]|nr:hypothetical protein K439DRAFT_106070 [Ramaria rubella]